MKMKRIVGTAIVVMVVVMIAGFMGCGGSDSGGGGGGFGVGLPGAVSAKSVQAASGADLTATAAGKTKADTLWGAFSNFTTALSGALDEADKDVEPKTTFGAKVATSGDLKTLEYRKTLKDSTKALAFLNQQSATTSDIQAAAIDANINARFTGTNISVNEAGSSTLKDGGKVVSTITSKVKYNISKGYLHVGSNYFSGVITITQDGNTNLSFAASAVSVSGSDIRTSGTSTGKKTITATVAIGDGTNGAIFVASAAVNSSLTDRLSRATNGGTNANYSDVDVYTADGKTKLFTIEGGGADLMGYLGNLAYGYNVADY